jgi:hypothetical protein
LNQAKEGEKQQQAGDIQPSPEYQFAALIQAVPPDQRQVVMDVLNAMASQAKIETKIEPPAPQSPRVIVQYPRQRKAPIAGAVLAVLSGAAYIGWCYG